MLMKVCMCKSYQMVTLVASTVLPEDVVVSVDGGGSSSSMYWPMTQSDVIQCDLSYIHGDWDRDMIRDGLNAVVRVSELPQIHNKEIEVWKYLSRYSPPADRGFMFSAGDDNIISLVQNQMTVGHSGCSMGWVMRHIEFIAKNGIPAHREMILANPGRARCY